MDAPGTLQQATTYFANYEHCHDALVAVRWPDGVTKCPRCGSARVTYLANARPKLGDAAECPTPNMASS